MAILSCCPHGRAGFDTSFKKYVLSVAILQEIMQFKIDAKGRGWHHGVENASENYVEYWKFM